MVRRARYRGFAIAMHWLVALFVLSTVPVGIAMTEDALARNVQDTLFIFHKNVGVIIFLLVVARLAFRAFNPPPPLPDSVPALQKRVALGTHIALYALLLVMTVSGYSYVIMGGYPIEGLDALGIPALLPENEAASGVAQTVHLVSRIPLIALVIIHIAAALYHLLAKGDGVFYSMAPIVKR